MSLSTTERSNHSYSAIPGYLKIIILAQAATILSLTVWMYQEYLNDAYFQHYVISLLRTTFFPTPLLPRVPLSFFPFGPSPLLGSLGPGRGEAKDWRLLSRKA